MTPTPSLPSSSAAGAPPAGAPAVARPWRVWGALWIVYIVWGSTYLGMRVTVETMPALLGAGARFVLAGALLCLLVVARRGPRGIRVGRREAGGALLTGTLLMGANATVMAAEQEVPSSLAALLIASVPLWVLIYRTFAGERVGRAGVGALVLGFAGVALLLLPGDGGRSQAPLLALVVVLGAAAFWALGSFTTSRVTLPADPLASTAWQMLFGGTACLAAGLIGGEAGAVDPGAFSARSLVAFAYLVVFGSVIAFSAYAWLLRNAPLGRVATYAYVNPVVAIALGAVVLGETITAPMLAGAAVVVASVALVARLEARRRAAAACEGAHETAPERVSGSSVTSVSQAG